MSCHHKQSINTSLKKDIHFDFVKGQLHTNNKKINESFETVCLESIHQNLHQKALFFSVARWFRLFQRVSCKLSIKNDMSDINRE